MTSTRQDAIASIHGLLGLAMRAGQVATGQERCIGAVRNNSAKIVLMDEQTAANGQKKITDACKNYGVSFALLPINSVGQAVGKPNRTVAAVTYGPLADKILKKAQEAEILLSWSQDKKQIGLMGGLKIDE